LLLRKRLIALAGAALAASILAAAPAAHAAALAASTIRLAYGTEPQVTAADRALPPGGASGWYYLYINSQAGGGCAWAPAALLDPITSEPHCASNDYGWYCRVLNTYNGWQWNAAGTDVECVDPSKTYMFGFSGGHFKMETPDASQFIADQASFGGGWSQDEYVGTSSSEYFVASGAGADLGVSSSESSGHGWAFSTTSP
jgi:hypothetical protein